MLRSAGGSAPRQDAEIAKRQARPSLDVFTALAWGRPVGSLPGPWGRPSVGVSAAAARRLGWELAAATAPARVQSQGGRGPEIEPSTTRLRVRLTPLVLLAARLWVTTASCAYFSVVSWTSRRVLACRYWRARPIWAIWLCMCSAAPTCWRTRRAPSSQTMASFPAGALRASGSACWRKGAWIGRGERC